MMAGTHDLPSPREHCFQPFRELTVMIPITTWGKHLLMQTRASHVGSSS